MTPPPPPPWTEHPTVQTWLPLLKPFFARQEAPSAMSLKLGNGSKTPMWINAWCYMKALNKHFISRHYMGLKALVKQRACINCMQCIYSFTLKYVNLATVVAPKAFLTSSPLEQKPQPVEELKYYSPFP